MSARLHWRTNKSNIRPGASGRHPPGRSQVLHAGAQLSPLFPDPVKDEHTGGSGGAAPGTRWRRQTAGPFRGTASPSCRRSVPCPPVLPACSGGEQGRKPRKIPQSAADAAPPITAAGGKLLGLHNLRPHIGCQGLKGPKKPPSPILKIVFLLLLSNC